MNAGDPRRLIQSIAYVYADNQQRLRKRNSFEVVAHAVMHISVTEARRAMQRCGSWICGTYISKLEKGLCLLIRRKYTEEACSQLIAYSVQGDGLYGKKAEEMISWLLEIRPRILVNTGYGQLKGNRTTGSDGSFR